MTEMETTLFIEKGSLPQVGDELKLAMECSKLLESHYPGHLWGVNINTEGGIAVVKNFAVSSIYGYVIHLSNLLHDPKRRKIIIAGGEILERARLAHRSRGDAAKYVEGLPANKQPTNSGLVI